jgi:hypothetical protein
VNGDSNEGKLEAEKVEKSGEETTKASIDETEKPQLAPVQSQEMDESMEKAAGAEEPDEEEPEIYGTPEARVPPTLPDPHLPHPRGIADHNRTHCPPRSGCPICTAAAGRETAHKTDVRDKDGDEKVPTMGFDYNYTGDGDEPIKEDTFNRVTDVVSVVLKDFKTGSLWAHTAECKGPRDTWLVKRMVTDVESAGHAHIRFKSDGELAAKAVQAAIIGMRPPPRRTIPINPPAHEPMANGCIENGVKEVNIQLLKIKLGLEARIRKIISAKHAIVEWMLEHAAFILTRIPVHADGRTCYERATGRRWHGKLLNSENK